jgi:hypothetical protein
MPYINVDVDLDDVYDDMTSSEKKLMAEWLESDGYCIAGETDDYADDFTITDPSMEDEFWIEDLKKLFHGRLQLSAEDEETIKQIANKL